MSALRASSGLPSTKRSTNASSGSSPSNAPAMRAANSSASSTAGSSANRSIVRQRMSSSEVRPARSRSRTSPLRRSSSALLDRLDRQLEDLALGRAAHRVELAHLPADGDGVEEPPAGDLVHLRVVLDDGAALAHLLAGVHHLVAPVVERSGVHEPRGEDDVARAGLADELADQRVLPALLQLVHLGLRLQAGTLAESGPVDALDLDVEERDDLGIPALPCLGHRARPSAAPHAPSHPRREP